MNRAKVLFQFYDKNTLHLKENPFCKKYDLGYKIINNQRVKVEKFVDSKSQEIYYIDYNFSV